LYSLKCIHGVHYLQLGRHKVWCGKLISGTIRVDMCGMIWH